MVLRSLMHGWFRVTRSMTLGVRAMLLDSQGKVLLIRPSYPGGWIFPGGGLERGETAIDALARELKEETAVTLKGTPVLFGCYSHEREFPGDHVLLYVIRDFETGKFAPSMEIREARFFDLKNLPPEVTPGTLRRIEEVTKNRPPAASW
jgi:ADP-ribose pyrophosphatase YjhB (NUDIX family)